MKKRKNRKRSPATRRLTRRVSGPPRLSNVEINAIIDEDAATRRLIGEGDPATISRSIREEIEPIREASERGNLKALLDALERVDRWAPGLMRAARRGSRPRDTAAVLVPRWVLELVLDWFTREAESFDNAGPIRRWATNYKRDTRDFTRYLFVLDSRRKEEKKRRRGATRVESTKRGSVLHVEEHPVQDEKTGALRPSEIRSWVAGSPGASDYERAAQWANWIAQGARDSPPAGVLTGMYVPENRETAGTMRRSYRDVATNLRKGDWARYYPQGGIAFLCAKYRSR